MAIKNKRGDIPITILVIGVLAICLLAVFSFYFSDRNVKEDFVVIDAVEEAKLLGEKIELYENLQLDKVQIESFVKTEYDSDQDINFIYIAREKIKVRYNIPN